MIVGFCWGSGSAPGVIRCLQCGGDQGEHRAHWGDPLHDPLYDDNPGVWDTKPGIRITSSQITQISGLRSKGGSLAGLVPNDLVTQAPSLFIPALHYPQSWLYFPFNCNSYALSGSGARILALVTTRRYDAELWPWTTLATRWTPPTWSRCIGCSDVHRMLCFNSNWQ